MKWSTRKIMGITAIILFLVAFVTSFIIYPNVGEKILYGKHPPGRELEYLEYSEIIKSNNYECLESASLRAGGNLPQFVKEFNDCNI